MAERPEKFQKIPADDPQGKTTPEMTPGVIFSLWMKQHYRQSKMTYNY